MGKCVGECCSLVRFLLIIIYGECCPDLVAFTYRRHRDGKRRFSGDRENGLIVGAYIGLKTIDSTLFPGDKDVLGYKNVKFYDGSLEEWTKDVTLPVTR